MPRADREALGLFARATGDVNPLHVDRAYAASAGFDDNVAFGTLLVYEVLEQAAGRLGGGLRQVRAEFRAPVLVGQEYDVVWTEPEQDAAEARLRVGGRTVGVVRLRAGGAPAPTRSHDASFPLAAAVRTGVEDWQPGQVRPVSCRADHEAARLLAPAAAAAFGLDVLALLATVTRTVGMTCPGESAVLRSFDVRLDASGLQAPDGTATVLRVDRRFDVVEQKLAFAGATAVVTAGFRQPAPEGLAWENARALVEAGEFAGARALVVGASRGLGEAAARLLLAGGAEVLGTSRTPPAGLGGAPVLAADALQPGPPAVAAFAPTHLLWFPTPRITPNAARRWSGSGYDAYREVYVVAMEEWAAALAPLQGLLVPSSTYVDQHPAGLAEYAAAKALAERVADFLVERGTVGRVERPRLPPVRTQQNNAARGLSAAGLQDVGQAAGLLLPALRRLCAPTD